MVHRKINIKKKKVNHKKKRDVKIKSDNPNGFEDFENALQQLANINVFIN